MTYSRFLVNEDLGTGECISLGGVYDRWRHERCSSSAVMVMCEVAAKPTPKPTRMPMKITTRRPIIVTTAGLVDGDSNLSDVITNHGRNSFKGEVNERFTNLERRLEQMRNVFFNRQEVIDEIREKVSNITSIDTAVKEMQEKQTSMAKAIEDMKKIMILV